MAYRDFTIDRLSTEFGVDFQGARLFAAAQPVAPSAWLTETLALAHRSGFGTEKARSERLVSPVLVEIAQRNCYEVTVVSGESLEVDPLSGLTGTCDFVLSYTKGQDFIIAPFCCITGARKQEDDPIIIECAAQLIGTSRLNEREKKFIPTVYGCATTGVEWRFLKFENQIFTFDEDRYLINEVNKLLGALQQIADLTKPRVRVNK